MRKLVKAEKLLRPLVLQIPMMAGGEPSAEHRLPSTPYTAGAGVARGQNRLNTSAYSFGSLQDEGSLMLSFMHSSHKA